MSDIAKIGVTQSVNMVGKASDVAVAVLDAATGEGMDAVQTLAGAAEDTTGHLHTMANEALAEIEGERADLMKRIADFADRTQERLNKVLGAAAEAIPLP